MENYNVKLNMIKTFFHYILKESPCVLHKREYIKQGFLAPLAFHFTQLLLLVRIYFINI